MRRLWTSLADTYGATRWTREYGEEPSRAWEQALAGCTLADIARGVDLARRDTSGRLPNLGTFRSWCRDPYRPSDQPLPSVEQLASASSTGRRWLAFMRLEGILPMPPGMTVDDLDDALGDCDIEHMRAEVRRHTRALQAHYHAETDR